LSLGHGSTIGAILVLSAALTVAGCSSGSGSGSSTSAHGSNGTSSSLSGVTTTTLGLATATVGDDERVVSAKDKNCAPFSARGCLYSVVDTPTASGTLYAVELKLQFGDGTGRGAVFFFLGKRLLSNTPTLPPKTASPLGPGLEYVTDAPGGLSVLSPGHIAVRFVVSSRPNLCNACIGNDGTDTYVYGWRDALVLVSGKPPAGSAVIGEGRR
jgi:hypothetical protein